MTGIRAFYHFLHRQEKDSIVILFADINNIKTPEQKKKKKNTKRSIGAVTKEDTASST